MNQMVSRWLDIVIEKKLVYNTYLGHTLNSETNNVDNAKSDLGESMDIERAT